ncbi:MAG: peptidoglycan DD-metalloendopeptidase family protein [Candidatus Paceibacterota bacterium]
MIFPNLKGKKFGYVNLDLEAVLWRANKGSKTNPLNNPDVCNQFILDVHKKYNIDFSYGGWMEDRATLWQDSYLELEKKFNHLGLDINVPQDEPVAVDFNALVVRIDDDYPTNGGWGPRVILKNLEKDVYILYAHLDRDISCKVGDVLSVGQVFAKVGHAPENGNWFPHVHVQVIESEYFEYLKKEDDWEQFDGYGFKENIAVDSLRHPDPLQFIKLD